MSVRIATRNSVVVSPELRELIEKKCDRIGRRFRKMQPIQVTLGGEKGRFSAEILLSAGQFHVATLTQDADLGTAFDNSLRRVETQITRRKSKTRDERARKGADRKSKEKRREE